MNGRRGNLAAIARGALTGAARLEGTAARLDSGEAATYAIDGTLARGRLALAYRFGNLGKRDCHGWTRGPMAPFTTHGRGGCDGPSARSSRSRFRSIGGAATGCGRRRPKISAGSTIAARRSRR